MDQTILGLPLLANLPTSGDYTVSPISAIAVVKGIDSDGDEVYAVVMTEGMTPVESAGLVQFASTYADEVLRGLVRASYQPSEA